MKGQSEKIVHLEGQTFGKQGAPIVILHGLLGSGRNWTSIAKRLAARHKVVTLDLRNHGGSPWADEMSYALMAADVRAYIEQAALGPTTVIGHSMGGKTAMRLALDAPSLVERLVVVDIAPVDYDHSTGEYVEALRALDLDGVGSRSLLDQRLADKVSEPAIRAFLLQNLVRQDQGFAWRAHLVGLSKAMPSLMAFPTDDHDYYRGPALFLSGANSNYMTASEKPAIERLFQQVDHRIIADAGHWVHAEQPTAFLAHLQHFLDL